MTAVETQSARWENDVPMLRRLKSSETAMGKTEKERKKVTISRRMVRCRVKTDRKGEEESWIAWEVIMRKNRTKKALPIATNKHVQDAKNTGWFDLKSPHFLEIIMIRKILKVWENLNHARRITMRQEISSKGTANCRLLEIVVLGIIWDVT